MLNPALAECLHSAGCCGDTEGIRPDSPHEGNHSPIAEIIHAGNITQNSLGTQGKERSTWLVAGECAVAFGMVSWVGFPTFSCFS